MASDSVRALRSGAPATTPLRSRSQARRRGRSLDGVGLDQPFFDDKNRAFWVLQSTGWTGYFILRSLSGFANSWARCSSSTRCC